MVRGTTRCASCPRIDDAVAAALSPAQIALAVRARTIPAECVARLRAIVARGVAADDDVPRLENLVGYGEAIDWAMALKADVEKHRADPSSVPRSAPTRRILLGGPPGCGKSQFAAALAKSPTPTRRPRAPGSSATSCRPAAARAEALAAARRAGACVYLRDEADAIPGREKAARDPHASWWFAVLAALLPIVEARAAPGLIFVACSNRPGDLDGALLRPGRLGKTVILGPSRDAAQTAAMLRTHLRADLPDADLVALARLMPAATGRSLAGRHRGPPGGAIGQSRPRLRRPRRRGAAARDAAGRRSAPDCPA